MVALAFLLGVVGGGVLALGFGVWTGLSIWAVIEFFLVGLWEGLCGRQTLVPQEPVVAHQESASESWSDNMSMVALTPTLTRSGVLCAVCGSLSGRLLETRCCQAPVHADCFNFNDSKCPRYGDCD